MPDTKQTVKARTESHSDVADSAAARAFQASTTEREFGNALLKRLREVNGPVRLQNLQEEWISTESGLAYEISVEVVPQEEAA